MRILIAGATGVIGRRLVPLLLAEGHTVIGTTRTPEKAAVLRGMGAESVVVDALNRDAVLATVVEAKPEVIVHQLTAIAGSPNLRHFDEYFAATNRLRIEGTDNLLRAAEAADVRRFVAQSYTGWPNERSGSLVKTEEDPIDPHPAAGSRRSLAAIRHVETAVVAAPLEGVVLRYGALYGPGNAIGAGGDVLRMVRRRQLPIVGGGTGVWSFIHVDDAARATAMATDGGPTGIYNIVDDEPAPVRLWLPYLAKAVGAKPPLRLPAWLVRPMLGAYGVSVMTAIRGSSNAKARRDLGWVPTYGSWREGFREGLG